MISTKKFLAYVYNNFTGNFLGFVIGMASTRLVSHFFTTRSIKNLWGLTARRTVLDKQTFSALEMMISIVIGFIVFEIISKWVKKKMDAMMPKYKLTRWMIDEEAPKEVEKANQY
jgi:cellobiose-specific phosphotransferase system component IIC